MSWSLPFSGDINEVTKQFEAEQERAQSYGMPAMERTEIGDALKFVRAIMVHNEGLRVAGTAGGHWNLAYGDLVEATPDTPAHRQLDEKASTFGRIYVTIDKA